MPHCNDHRPVHRPLTQRSNAGRLASVTALLLLTAAATSSCTPDAPSSGGESTNDAPADTTAADGDAGSVDPATTARVTFVDKASDRGLDFVHTDGSTGKYYTTETLASGVLFLDYDQDGRLDVYFPNGRMLPPGAKPTGDVARATPRNALFKQQSDGSFVDVTEKAGVPGTGFGFGGCVGDYDGDGNLDLYVCQVGPNVLYRNRGDGTFEDVTSRAGVAGDGMTAGAAFFDADGDGDLDLYVTKYCVEDYSKPKPCYVGDVPGYCPPAHFQPAPDHFFRNEGDGTFTEASESSGIHGPSPGRGLGVLASDVDRDGDLDLFVANDGSENFLLQNDGQGRFEEVGLLQGVALDANGDHQGCMGIDIADINRDGRPDIVVTNYQKQSNALYSMGDGGFFSDIAMRAGLSARSLPWVGWGTGFIDYDNDGLLDTFIANGHLEDQVERKDQSSTYEQPNQLLRGRGDGTFEDVSTISGSGLQLVLSSRGTAFGDVDNDGDIDILISNTREAPNLLINHGGNEQPWLGLRLVAATDPFAMNARATVFTSRGEMAREVCSGASYVSQNDLRLHFGLGDAEVERIEVLWPDGSRETFTDVPLETYTTIEQGSGGVDTSR